MLIIEVGVLAISKGFCETMRILPKDSELLGFSEFEMKNDENHPSHVCVFILSKNGEKASLSCVWMTTSTPFI
jgi:hypothetical protein